MRTVKFATLIVAASATLFGCSSKEEPPATAPVAEGTAEPADTQEDAAATAAIDRREACNLTMSAPESADWTTYWLPSGGANGAQSVHWANEAEKAAQASNFLAIPLEITCASEDSPSISITLSAPNATESEIPMSGGSYPIYGRDQIAIKGAQFMTKALSYNGRSFEARKGTLTISEFTSGRVSGSFTVEGVETGTEDGAPIRLQGTFEFPCRGGLMESACTARQR